MTLRGCSLNWKGRHEFVANTVAFGLVAESLDSRCGQAADRKRGN
jgi:hypothetical protein